MDSPRTPEQPRTLRTDLAHHVARARDLVVAVMARSGELGPYLQMLHEAGERAERMTLVIPRELAEKVERGDWSWVEAKDGS